MKRKLLSVLLTFCLAFSLLPTAALADSKGTQTNDVAQIGSTGYASLADAIAAANDGETVTLLKDVIQNTMLTIDKNITLNLNEKKIYNTENIWNEAKQTYELINVEAEVTITGNGSIEAKENDCYTINVKNGNLTIENGTFVGNVSVVQVESGTLTIKGGEFMLLQKWEGTSKYLINCIDKNYENKSAVVDIRGGKFVDFDPNDAPEKKVDGKAPSFVISAGIGVTKDVDGNFTAVPNMAAQIVDADGNSVKAYDGQNDAIKAAENGQTVILLSDRKNYVTNTIDNNITIDLNGKTLSLGNNNPFFRTNGEVTIQNGTIDSNSACVIVNAYNKLTLKNVKITGVTGDNGKNLVNVCSNAEVTIDKDTVLTASGSGVAVFIGQDADAKYTLNVYGKLIQQDKSFAICGNGSYKGTTTINIYDGAEVKSASAAIYQPQAGAINVTGGLVEGYCAIGIKSGMLNISGGTVRGTANDYVLSDENSNGDGLSYDGSAIIVDSRSAGYAGNVKINVTGGTVESRYSTAIREIGEQDKPDMTQLVELNVTGGNVLGAGSNTGNVTNDMLVRDVSVKNVSVSGGTFNHEVQSDYCADKFVPVNNNDGTYGVKINENMAAEVLDAQGNTVGAYDTLADAITAAKNGETVKLLKDVTDKVSISKNLVLDLNGKTLTGKDLVNLNSNRKNERIALTANAGEVKVKNGIIDGRVNAYNSADLTIDADVTVKNSYNGSGYDCFGIVVWGDGTFGQNGCKTPKLTVNGKVIMEKGGVAISTNGTDKSCAVVTINDGAVISTTEDGAIYLPSGKLTMNGGTVSGPTGIQICAGTADITADFKLNKGTVTATGTDQRTSKGTGDGLIPDGAAISVVNRNYPNGVPSVTINGGSFSSVNSDAVLAYKWSEGTASEWTDAKTYVKINDGYFTSDPSAYVVNNGSANIVKRDGSEGAYTYTVLARSGLTSGVYLTNPSGALASNYYVSSTANGVWTVSYSAPYSGSSSYDPTYSVSTPSKTEHGTVTVSPKSASKGDTVTVTVKPDSGYVLETLTVTDKNGNELTLKDKGNGKYTFTMPAGKVEVKATFMEDNSMLNFFYDVPNNAYFYEAVKWAVEKGITTGVGNGLFAPEQPCTRAQIVTFLWRTAGSPEPKGASSFADVAAGSYYAKAVAWAVENGITTGTTTSTFSPDATCTRAQAVTFLARALSAKASGKAEFSDVPADSYFADAVAWAAANGVTEGIGGGLFGSDNDCTRGQIVTFLYRAYNK